MLRTALCCIRRKWNWFKENYFVDLLQPNIFAINLEILDYVEWLFCDLPTFLAYLTQSGLPPGFFKVS